MKTAYCKTLVEFYDRNGMCNIVGPLSFRPKRVIYLCGSLPDGNERGKLNEFVTRYSKKTSVLFIQCELENPSAVIEKLKSIHTACGALTVELTGGGESAAFAAGLFIHCGDGRTSSVVQYSFDSGEYRWFTRKGRRSDDVLSPNIRFNICQLFESSGGEVTGFARVKPKEFTPELCSYIMKVWKVFVRHCDEWSRFASYIQYAVKKYGKENSLYLSAPVEACVNDKEKRHCPIDIMEELSETGVIASFAKSEDGRKVSFRFRSDLLKYFLCDGGMWLELYCRVTAMNTDGGKFYDDCAQSVLVKWGGEGKTETTNEIDCVVTRGMRSVFISCKLAVPQVSALNEIRTLTDRFGGEGGHAMLVTMGSLSDASHIVARAAELGVTLVGRETLKSGCFGAVLKSLIEK